MWGLYDSRTNEPNHNHLIKEYDSKTSSLFIINEYGISP